jgi:hypothetical protein
LLVTALLLAAPERTALLLAAPERTALWLAAPERTALWLAAPEQTAANWPGRIALTLLTLAFFGLIVFTMRRTWRRWAAEQENLLPLPVAPRLGGEPLVEVTTGLFIGTTREGDWQARIVAGGLSNRARTTVRLTEEGLLLDRHGDDDLFIPRESFRDARIHNAHAGKVIGPGGLLVVTWQHGEVLLETSFRADDHALHLTYLPILRSMVPADPQPPTPRSERPE